MADGIVDRDGKPISGDGSGRTLARTIGTAEGLLIATANPSGEGEPVFTLIAGTAEGMDAGGDPIKFHNVLAMMAASVFGGRDVTGRAKITFIVERKPLEPEDIAAIEFAANRG